MLQSYLESASGSRMLSLVRCRATVQLLLVQTCGDVHSQHWQRIPNIALLTMLDLLQYISTASRDLDADMELRRQLACRQAEGQVRGLRCSTRSPDFLLQSLPVQYVDFSNLFPPDSWSIQWIF